MQTYFRRKGKAKKLIWRSSHTLTKVIETEQHNLIEIPIQFKIPSNCTSTNHDEKIVWELHVEFLGDGVSFKERFEVPVFHVENYREEVKVEDLPSSPRVFKTLNSDQEVVSLDDQLRKQGIIVEPLGNKEGIRYISPTVRYPFGTLVFSLFNLVWFGMIVFAGVGDSIFILGMFIIF